MRYGTAGCASALTAQTSGRTASIWQAFLRFIGPPRPRIVLLQRELSAINKWAAASIPRSFWAGTYYRSRRAQGCSHQAALRALAFKWIRILYRCWQTRTPYDESTYLNALKRRGSPLLISMAPIAKTS